jgi:hypothetical protein
MDQKIKVLEIAIQSLKNTKFSIQYEDLQIRFNTLIDILEEGEK